MNYKVLIIAFFFGWIGSTTTSLAQESIFQEKEVYQGTSLPIYVNAPVGSSVIAIPIESSTLELTNINGSTHTYLYTPDPNYLGDDGFTIQAIEQIFPTPVTKEYTFQIQVIASMVNTNPDFVHLTSDNDLVIDVLDNDETSSENLTITIAHVLRGQAVVNEDQTITYTPAEEMDKDYIVYTVSDEYNTVSTSTVYLSHVFDLEQESTVRNYQMASGNDEYIILPNDEMTWLEESYDYGSLEMINDFVYKYTADSNVEGTDSVRFTDIDGHEYTAQIEILEKYNDVGNIRDDVFYSAANTNVVFDVTLNDLVDQYVIADYSSELQHLGSGVFSYTPPPYFTGIQEFFYTTDNGFTEETGTIELIINNHEPTTAFEYNLSTPQNQPRIIEYDVPIGTEYFEIAALPDHGSIEVFTDQESVDLACEQGLQKVFALYTPDNDYVGTDEFMIRYCASDNNICKNVNIDLDVVATDVEDCICVNDCVWPGDANGDGKVSVVDVLSIGRFLGQGGAARDNSSYGAIYEGASAEDWTMLQVNGKNIKHADTNGDGVITIDDLDAVVDNYGDINSVVKSDVLGVKNLPFTLTANSTDVDSGEVFELFVSIGNQNFPAIDLQGVSFALNLSPDFVDSSSVEVVYPEWGYLVKDAPYVNLTHQPVDGTIHTVATKTNGLGSTGFGVVATVSFIVEEDALGIKDTRSTNANGDQTVRINASDIIIEDSKGYKYALPNTYLDVVVNGNEIVNADQELFIFPNPADHMITVETEGKDVLNSVQILSMEGKLIKQISVIRDESVDIDVANLNRGLYIIQAKGEHQSYTSKLIKQ